MLFKRRDKRIARELRVNEKVRAKEVRLIGEAGEQLGVMPLFQAVQIARERNTDLVEVAPTAVPPVCRLMDFGKFKYEQAKKERDARKHQKSVLLREVRFRPKIDEHDINFKVKIIQKLLGEGDKVKVSVMFRGREVTHPQLGKQLLDRVAESLKEASSIEKPAAMEGRNMTMILTPAVAVAARPAREARSAEES